MFLQQLVNGVANGATYALIALGFALVYSVLRMVNFAHGDVYIFGVFVTLWCLNGDVPAPIAVLAGLAAGAALAVVVERVAYRPLRNAHPMMPLVTAVAAALLIRQITVLLFGLQTYAFPQVLSTPVSFLGIEVSGTKLLSLGVAVVVALALTLFLQRTRWGRAILLMRQDLEAARLMGIPVDRMVSVIYALGGLLGVIGGLLASSTSGALNANMGLQGTINAFIAAILGGLGGLFSAVVGGLALGVIYAMSAAYLSASYSTAISFGVLVLVLLVRPAGLVPGAGARRHEARV